MFSRIFLALPAFALLAAATNHPITTTVTVTAPGPTATAMPPSQCNTGGLQCCNSVEKASAPTAAALLGLLGVLVQDVNVLVGITCSPIGIGSNSCTAQPVCCSNNEFHGVVAIGCTPININL